MPDVGMAGIGGFLHHLRDNLALRAVFELGPPTLKSRRMTKVSGSNRC